MAMPGGRTPSAPPPLRPTPNPRPTPSVSAAAARTAVLRWGTLIGGLVIIVDLGTKALQQRLAAGGDASNAVYSLSLILNAVLFSIAGASTLRETHSIRLAALAGLLAGLLDGVVVAAADALTPPIPPPPAGTPPLSQADMIGSDIVLNALIGVVLAAASAWFTRLGQRRRGS
jgi:hypothetical protein